MERVATSPDTSTLSHSYDAGGRLLAIEGSLVHDPGTRDFVTSIAYNARGQRTEVVVGNDTRTRTTYDPHRFWPTRILTERTSDSPVTKLQDLALSYDVVGNVTGITDDAQQTEFFANVQVDADQAFAYDALYRLVSATGREKAALAQPGAADPTPGGVPDGGAANTVMARYTEEFQYDQAGNLTEMKHIRGGSTAWRRGYAVAADSNRLVKSSVPGDDPDDPGTYSDLYTTSARGAMVRMPHLRGGMDNLVPDHRDQVRKAELNSSGDVAWYAYGADKKRVMKRVIRGQNVEDRIYVGGWELWRKRVSGALQEERQTLHVLDGDKRVCLVETKTWAGGSAVATPVPRFRYQLGNHLDSALLEVDDAGAVISYEEYHPYGSTAWWAAKAGVDVSRKRYRYTGMERDEETGLQVHHHRYYAPWLGRWTSADPAGLVDGGNRWGYARGRPTGGRDPSGLATEESESLVRTALGAKVTFTMAQVGTVLQHAGDLADLAPTAARFGVGGFEGAALGEGLDKIDLGGRLQGAGESLLAEAYQRDSTTAALGSGTVSIGETLAAVVGVATTVRGFRQAGQRAMRQLDQQFSELVARAFDNAVRGLADDLAASARGRRGPKGVGLFEEFGVTPGQNLDLVTPSSVAGDGRSYITYAFRNEAGEVAYVGRASGPGGPSEVIQGRIAKGHDHWHEGLTAQVIDVQGTNLASQGAEEFFVQGFIERGAQLTNVDPALSYGSASRTSRSMEKVEAFFIDLLGRQNQ